MTCNEVPLDRNGRVDIIDVEICTSTMRPLDVYVPPLSFTLKKKKETQQKQHFRWKEANEC